MNDLIDRTNFKMRRSRFFHSVIIIICLVAFLLLFPRSIFFDSPSPFSLPFIDISLTDWDLKNVSSIGFASIGIQHEKKKEKIVFYYLKEHPPSFKHFTKIKRLISSKENIFLVSHFEEENMNQEGGYFNSFSKFPSEAAVSLGKDLAGSHFLSLNYHNQLPGFSGLWLHLLDSSFPSSQTAFIDSTDFAYLTFSIRGEKGRENLMLQIGDDDWEKKQDSLPLGLVSSFLPSGKITTEWQQIWIPLSQLPEQLDRKKLALLVLKTAGDEKGQIYLKEVAFTKEKGIKIPIKTVSHVFNQGMWLWETEKILKSEFEQKKLVDFCRSEKITDLFLQIPYSAEEKNGKWSIQWNSSKMRPLLSQLHQAKVKVHALDGDPRYALKQWNGRLLAFIQEVARYNQQVSPSERFDAIRYDNEPYLLPAFQGVAKESILKQYLELLKASYALCKQNRLQLGVDIPFWFDERNEFFEPIANLSGRPMSELIIDNVDNIGIMDYRTQSYGKDGVIAQARSELEYAMQRGKKVFVGLETTNFPDETLLQFAQQGEGSKLVLKHLSQNKVRVYWIGEDQKSALQNNPELFKNSVILNQTKKVFLPASKITFAKKTLKDLREVMSRSAFEFEKYSSFYGFAIHSYESYSELLKSSKDSKLTSTSFEDFYIQEEIGDLSLYRSNRFF